MNQTLELPASVRNSSPAPTLSDRYVPVDTMAVISAMEASGFVVASVQGAIRSNNEFSRHSVDFRHPDVPAIGDAVPRVLFVNSHDGSTRASALAGVFRFVCSNGMVVGSTYAQERTLHVGETARTLIERMQALAKNTAPLFKQIEHWQRKELSASAEWDFARFASHLRWGDAGRFPTSEVLKVRRGEDEGRDLWSVFNRVQENTTNAGLLGATTTGRNTVSRPLQAVGANLLYNQQLWRLAEEFAGA